MKWEIIVPVVIAIASPLFFLAYNKKKDFKKIWPFIYKIYWGLLLIMSVWNFALDFYHLKLSENYDRDMGNPELYYETIEKAKASSEILRTWNGVIIGFSSLMILILLHITYNFLNTEDSNSEK